MTSQTSGNFDIIQYDERAKLREWCAHRRSLCILPYDDKSFLGYR